MLFIKYINIFSARRLFRSINYYYIYPFLKGDHIFMGYAYMNQSCPCPPQPFTARTSVTQTCTPQTSMAQTSAPQTSMAQGSIPQTSMAQSSAPLTPPSMSPNAYGFYCPNTAPGGMEQYPVGMGYVPWQQWQQTYPLEQGFNRGTIFPDLDLPFMMGRCIR